MGITSSTVRWRAFLFALLWLALGSLAPAAAQDSPQVARGSSWLAGQVHKVEAAGYLARVLPLATDGRDPVDMQAIELAHGSVPVTISGRVTDGASGQGIARAAVTVLGAELAALADAEGRYRIAGVLPGAATVRFSAPGYTGETVILDVWPYNLQRLDHALQAGQDSTLALEMATDRQAYSAYGRRRRTALERGGKQPEGARHLPELPDEGIGRPVHQMSMLAATKEKP